VPEVSDAARVWQSADAVPLSEEIIRRIVEEKVSAALPQLDEAKRLKLGHKLAEFYACYSGTNFEGFRILRLQRPFRIGENLGTFLGELASKGVHVPDTDEGKVRVAWERLNGTNRITHIDPASVTISTFEVTRLDRSYLKISISGLPTAIPLCWDHYVESLPTLEEVLGKGGPVLCFSAEQFVRMNLKREGCANAIKILGFWDETSSDWVLWNLCLMLSENYGTLF
jgi:hypothetical protein